MAVLAADAADAQAAMLVLPEAASDVRPEPSDGGWAEEAAALARRHRLAILLGYAERCTTGLSGAAMLIDRHGICIANYRQTHVREPDRRQAGQWLSVMPVDSHKIGLLVGYDIEFPEPARALALAGCGLIVVLGGHSDRDAGILLPARARENRCWIAYCGETPRLLGPDGSGQPLERRGPIEIGQARPDIDAGAGRADLLRDRQPRLYRELTHFPSAEMVRPS